MDDHGDHQEQDQEIMKLDLGDDQDQEIMNLDLGDDQDHQEIMRIMNLE